MANKKSSVTDRALPFDRDAEMGMLGGIMLLPSCLDDVSLIVYPEDLYDTAHAIWYCAMREIYEAHGFVDPTLLIDSVRTSGTLDAAGGTVYLSKIINAVPNAAHTTYYAEIVKEKARARAIIKHCTKALGDAYSDLPATEIITELENKLTQIEHPGLGEPVLIADAAQEVLDAIAEPVDHTNRAWTGLPRFDQILGPMLAGELVVIGARPSVGKTAFTQQICAYSARQGRPALLVSLEMASRELASREMCKIAGIDSRLIRRGSVSHDDYHDLQVAQQGMVGMPLYIWAPLRATATEIRAVAKRRKNQSGLGLLAVDLIGLVAAERELAHRKREEQIRIICANLKAIGKELRIPVIITSQLGRDAASEEPKLSHLRDSGRVEEDADIVMLLHYNKTKPNNCREVNVAKHRNGPVGWNTLAFNPQLTVFSDQEASDLPA